MLRRLVSTPLAWMALAVIVAAAAFGGYWFQPWKIVVDRNVAEPLSDPVPEPATPTAGTSAAGTPTATGPTTPTGAGPGPAALVRQGRFVTHEHDTTGTARIVRGADGRHRLELVDLATSNGPDLRIWLTDQPVRKGAAGWRVFDDGEWVELGRLKGNQGDQAYVIPTDVDLDGLRSVSIWCRRFAVSFGAAELSSVR